MPRTLFAMILFLVFCTGASAMDFPTPKAEYSAVRVMTSQEGTISQKVNVAGVKQRAEMEMQGMKMITIIRPDRNLTWMIIPAYNMYQEIDFSQAQKDRHFLPVEPEADAKITKIGPDEVDGMKTTKYHMAANDNKSEGHIWLNDDNIPVRMEIADTSSRGTSTVVMTLKDLKVGKQDPSLFEVPAGFNQMPGMPGMGKGMMSGPLQSMGLDPNN